MERICYRGVRECAEALGISERTLKNLYKNDLTFPVVKTGPRNNIYLFPVEQIKAWMTSRINGRQEAARA